MQRHKYPIAPEFSIWRYMHAPIHRTLLRLIQTPMEQLYRVQRSTKDMKVERLSFKSFDGAALTALMFTPISLAPCAPCLIYCHGGGFVFPAAPSHFRLVREYAVQAGCKVLFPLYRLAPGHPFPIGVKDCFAAYQAVHQNADVLSIDAHRIAVGGDSAGGTLATVICLMAREKGLPLPLAQLLIYPLAAHGIETESMKKYVDTPMCNSRDVAKYDALYVTDPAAAPFEYRSPYHAQTLEGQPPAYIETAEFDCLRDGAILYAERLKESGVPTTLNNTKGTMHGFDVVKRSPIVHACIAKRTAFLKSAFSSAEQ